MLKIIRIPFPNLRKNDFPEIIQGSLEIMKKHNPQALFLQVMYSKLGSYEQSLHLFIGTGSIKNPMTQVLNQRYTRARELFSAIKFQLKSLKSSNSQEDKQALITLDKMLGTTLGDSIFAAKYNVRKALDEVCELFNDDDFVAASEKTGIKKYVDELEAVRNEIGGFESQKVEFKVKKKMSNLPALKSEIIGCYQNMVQAVELAQVEHPEIDYKPLIAEFNEFVLPYLVEIKKSKTRKTNNQTDKTTTAALSTKTPAAAI